MNSMIVLNELRAAKVKKQKQKVQCTEVKKQLEHILILQRKRAALNAKLKKLSQGIITEDRVQHLRVGKNVLNTLKEKLYSYRLIGPCGLTVADVDKDLLVVTFTPVWKNITESYILKIVAVGEHIKVSGTSIPYFIDVQSLLNKSKSSSWSQIMDNIGHILCAYVQRKGELDFVMQEYKEFIKSTSSDEPLTSIEIILCQKDRPAGLEKQVSLYMVYPGVDSILPNKTIITTEKVHITNPTALELGQKLMISPLSTAMPDVLGTIVSSFR